MHWKGRGHTSRFLDASPNSVADLLGGAMALKKEHRRQHTFKNTRKSVTEAYLLVASFPLAEINAFVEHVSVARAATHSTSHIARVAAACGVIGILVRHDYRVSDLFNRLLIVCLTGAWLSPRGLS